MVPMIFLQGQTLDVALWRPGPGFCNSAYARVCARRTFVTAVGIWKIRSAKSWFSYGCLQFPINSYRFPMVSYDFRWVPIDCYRFPIASHGFRNVFLWFPLDCYNSVFFLWTSYGFLSVSLFFSCGFLWTPMVFPSLSSVSRWYITQYDPHKDT